MRTAGRARRDSDGGQLRYYSDQQVVARYAADDYELTDSERGLFDAHLRPGMDVLDLGVGGGRTTPYLSALSGGGTYVGLDVAEPMVAACQERFPHLAFHHADAADLSLFGDGSFDAVVFSFNGIDYVAPGQRRADCLAECRRVLRDGGVLVLSRHNPRALLAVPTWRPRALLWCLRRTVRMLPTRAFWTGHGVVTEPGVGFNGPLLGGRARGRNGTGDAGDTGPPPLPTAMATPRRVARELADAQFDLVTTAGGVRPDRTWTGATSWYHYVARRRPRVRG